MPKEYFQLANSTELSALPAGSKIHFIGVAGVAMGQLAAAMSESGYQVSGSDKAFYEPMGSFLKSKNLKLFDGYSANNITADYDLVVIGNAVSYGHPEVDQVEKLRLKYTCFPKLLAEFLISNKKSIVVTGTHGKTTTSGLIAQSLISLSDNPSYFIGGVVPDLSESLLSQPGSYVVTEGDEYDSAFFAKVPKFTFYKPDICIINAIEFDHADIYENLDKIILEFNKLVENLKPGSSLIVCTDFSAVAESLNTWKKRSDINIITFGLEAGTDYRIDYQPSSPLKITETKNNQSITIDSSLIGSYNARNLTAAFIALKLAGLPEDKIKISLSKTKAPKRRQEIFYRTDRNILMEDFAHHPTAIAETLSSVKKHFPEYQLIVALEPASNTLKTNLLESDLTNSLMLADKFFLYESFDREAPNALSTTNLIKNLTAAKVEAVAEKEIDQLYNALKQALNTGNNLLLLLSNRSFGNIKLKLLEDIKEGNLSLT